MLGILKQPYVFAIVLAIVTATLMYMYSRTVENDHDKCSKTFFKTLAIATTSGLALAYAATTLGGSGSGGGGGGGGGEQLSTEPFMAEPTMSR